MKAFLEHFAAILGAITATVLAMSWTHEYGYFWTIGRQFQTFLTTTDYITNGALWLPLGVLFVAQSITWRWLAPDASEKKEETKVWTSRLIWAVYAAWFIFIVATLTWPVDYSGALNLMVFAVLFWSRAWRRVYADIKLDEPFQLIARELIRVGPPVILGTLLYGSVNAQTDLTRTDSVYLFKFKEVTSPQLLVFLRTFDRGVLARDAVHNRIIFLKWDDIKEISLVSPEVSNSLSCWMIGWSCKEKYKAQLEAGPSNP